MQTALIEFVKDSVKAGKSQQEICTVLENAGWSSAQIKEALGRFVDEPFPVAIPKPMLFASPRLVFLNLFYFLVLYLSIYNVVSILFTFLDYYLPDGLGRMRGAFYSHRPIGEAIRWNLAIIICCVPLIFLSARSVARAAAVTKQHIPRVRLMLIYFTVFIGACILLGNASSFVYYFLSGELGIRFIIKVVILTILVAGLYGYFKSEVSQAEHDV